MYYIKFIMKNIFFKLIEYLYYLSFVLFLVLYLYPGSLIGYFLYGDLSKQPNIIDNPFDTSINHFLAFIFITTLAEISNLKKKQFFTNIYFIFLLSIILETSHYIIPNRAFELYDLLANIAGVLIIFLFKRIVE